MSAFCVGLTGGLASGKSTAGKLFADCGAAVFDADDIAAELTAAGGAALPGLREVLGGWAFAADGSLNRIAVREKVFADASDAGGGGDGGELRKKLESVLHPQIRELLRARLRGASAPYAVGIVPLLFESGGSWTSFFNRIVVVHCPPAEQRARALRRDAAKDADRVMAAQLPAAERLRRADDIVYNDGDFAKLSAAVAAMHGQYLQSAKMAG